MRWSYVRNTRQWEWHDGKVTWGYVARSTPEPGYIAFPHLQPPRRFPLLREAKTYVQTHVARRYPRRRRRR